MKGPDYAGLMQYRQLGRSGLRVSEVSLGGWLTHGRSITDDVTDSIVKRAFDLGVTTFDTADIYHKGEAELSLGKAIRGLKREHLVIATKCYWPMSEDPNDQGLSRKHIYESLHGSLTRMELDYVDLFQFHRFDPTVPIAEMVRAIDDLIRQGKVLYWGVSCWSAAQIAEACFTAKELNCSPPISNQPPYNLLQRGIEEEVIPTSDRFGLGQIVFSPLAQGILTGKYAPGSAVPAGSRASDETSNQFMQWLMTEENLTRVQQLKPIAAEAGLTLGQFALAWCLRRGEVDSVIVGATRVEQLEENVGASGAAVDGALFDRAEAVLRGE